MEHYVEIECDIRHQIDWFRSLTRVMRRYDARWQMTHHLTVAFMTEIGAMDDIYVALDHFNVDEVVTLDRIEVFTEFSDKEHIIAIGSSKLSQALNESIDRLRKQLVGIGCVIPMPFKFHITLGRIDANKVPLEELKVELNKVHLPEFNLCLDKVRFIRRQDHTIIWQNFKSK